jgi:O-antigen chain-terminating methyltransferase
MKETSIDTRDDEINVEEIMEKIREKIRKRQATEEMNADPDSQISSGSINDRADISDLRVQRDFSTINSLWDITNNGYLIRSHNPYIGKFLIKGRQLVHGEVRRYVDPMISRQVEFNTSTLRILTWASQQFTSSDMHQKELEKTFSSYQSESEKQFADYKQELSILVKETADARVKELFIDMENDIQARAWLARLLEDRMRKGLSLTYAPLISASKTDANYFLFEERFRGSREDIKQRQLAFIPYFENCSNVLDIGCGRGEFLELLRNNGIGGTGVDIDEDMVAYCRSLKLTVALSDAIEYIKDLEDKSLDGIFIDQVVEHLAPDYLIRLLELCHRKLKCGCYIVIETVNPLSFFSFANFFIDLTHKRPLHPQTLHFLLNSNGLRDIEVKYLAPVPDDSRLQPLPVPESPEEGLWLSTDIYNRNIGLLNNILFGPQDYAMIGKK